MRLISNLFITIICLLYYSIYIVFYFVKRIFFMLFYPIAYIFRDWARDNSHYFYDYYNKDENGNRIVRKKKWGKRNILATFLWFALDDVCKFENAYHEWIKAPSWLPTEFLKAYYWGAIRNNGVNLSRAMAIKNYYGKLYVLGNHKNRFEIKKFKSFPYFAPYFQFYIPFTEIRVKAGWLTNGKYEMSIRRK